MHNPTSATRSPAVRVLNVLLLASFIVTMLPPLTGITVHKLASTLFLILSLIHTIACRKGLTAKRTAMLAVIILAFLSGILGMIFDEIPLVLALHKAISIASVFFLAIHMFIFRKRIV